MSHAKDKENIKNAREQVKLERRLIETSTSQIALHLLFRHRFFLSVLTNTILVTYLIVHQLT